MAVKKKTAKPRKGAAPKTRNSGTMNESAFWSFIRSALRQKSRWWKPIAECKANAKRVYKGPNKRQKFEYQCNHCSKWFPDKQINVDHIVPAGTLRNANDLPAFVERLFVEAEGLQVLCQGCHNIKTQNEKQTTK
jgi:5-methylcytosine-specific restriction endonuclease McrA